MVVCLLYVFSLLIHYLFSCICNNFWIYLILFYGILNSLTGPISSFNGRHFSCRENKEIEWKFGTEEVAFGLFFFLCVCAPCKYMGIIVLYTSVCMHMYVCIYY